MIDWKKPELNDLKMIREAAFRSCCMGSDMSAVNIFLLADKYDLQIAFIGDLLVRKYKTIDTNLGRNGYTFPVGCSFSDKKCIDAVLDELQEEADRREVPLSFCLLTEEQKWYLENRYPDMEFVSYPGDSDYLYTAEHLGLLPGRANHKKKNHVSRFRREFPDFEFKVFEKHNRDQCGDAPCVCDLYRVEEAWIKERENSLEHSQVLEKQEIKTAVRLFPELELIGAARLMKIRPKANDENSYLHFVNICSELGVNIVPMLDRMIVFDYIIANEDRHFGNFGLLRDPDTLEWTGAAPIFDNGTSLWYDKLTSQIPETDIICKPFKNTHGEQLRMVSSFDWLDISKLDGLEDEIYEILSDEKVKKYIDAERADMLVSQIRKRIDRLSEVVMVQNSSQDISSINDDIKEDEAASYGITIK